MLFDLISVSEKEKKCSRTPAKVPSFSFVQSVMQHIEAHTAKLHFYNMFYKPNNNCIIVGEVLTTSNVSTTGEKENATNSLMTCGKALDVQGRNKVLTSYNNFTKTIH